MRVSTSLFTLRWLLQAGLGLLLMILLAIHLIVNHWVTPQGLLTYADIVHYYDIPGIALMESIFLTVVTVHCALGIHSILLDLNLPPRATRVATGLLMGTGFLTLTYGLWLIRIILLR